VTRGFPGGWGGPWARRLLWCCAGVVVGAAATGVARPETTWLLDSFDEVRAWQAQPAEGVTMALAPDLGVKGGGMRLEYDFQGRGGWASARRLLPLELPENWELSLYWRGTPARQTLEVKLLDPSGENVWWSVRREVPIPQRWERLTIKKRHLSFAWGPRGGGELIEVGYVELALTAGEGGAGSVWFDELALTPLPPAQEYQGTPQLSASASAAGTAPSLAMDGDPATCWRSPPGARDAQWLAVDFGARREFGGLVIAWGEGGAAGAFTVELSRDGSQWETLWEVAASHGRRSFVPLPEADARFLRLRMAEPPLAGVAVAELEVQPLDFAATPNQFFAAVAQRGRRGVYPRGVVGEMSQWTVVGASPGGDWRGLLGADGAFEVAPGSYSLEPFVVCDGQLVTWADVTTAQSLLSGALPIPTVVWSHPCFFLEVTVLVPEVGAPPASLVRYRLTRRRHSNPLSLALALRPFQVNPPSQFLGYAGGVAERQSLTVGEAAAVLEPAGLEFFPRPRPTATGVAAFDGGDIVALLERGQLPYRQASGPYPSAAWRWDFPASSPATAEVVVVIPHGPGARAAWGLRRRENGPHAIPAEDWGRMFATHLECSAQLWRQRLTGVEFRLPRAAEDLLQTALANLAYILINRDGAALQPGARAYRRAWIRDGAMMAAALLRLGKTEEVAQFARWYATYQYANGKVPCCVDHRGADPVPEHDSDGQFIFLVAETVRLAGDRALAAELWPAVQAAAGHIDALRAKRRTDAFRSGDAQRFFGLLPESISHEGYSAKPMHSYWDTFWALRGLADAAALAGMLGYDGDAGRLAAARDQLRSDLIASLQLTMSHHGIDYLPGCVELGDFDPTSTTVALAPLQIGHWLPARALERTFEAYWERFLARRDGAVPWREYTPYELRAVGAFLRLGWRERAWELLEWFMAHRQPVHWRQWPEIVWRDQRTARFVGDLPHTWVGSDFLRAYLDIFAFEREQDGTLVLAAGVPACWLDSGETVGVTGLRTSYGPLTYSMARGGGLIKLRVEAGLGMPPGGVAVALPGIPPGWEAHANGKKLRASPRGEFLLHELPCEMLVAQPAGRP